jgi:plasmid stability protein
MTTNIQVRAVDDDLAAKAKQRATQTHRSVSAYVRDLIAEDVARSESQNAMASLLEEISNDPDRPRVSHDDVLWAIGQARREMGVE